VFVPVKPFQHGLTFASKFHANPSILGYVLGLCIKHKPRLEKPAGTKKKHSSLLFPFVAEEELFL
jgi:hypothetical protein